ncbi:exopolysaccharide biosynthesis protein [Microbaculum marinum]|uniref:Exopolysaccharide biosynthesis protein n=1 Tax=Microbaculum marinum TaxID=1764581 RepID=A0AAW9RW58_9HYPH
MSEQSQPHNLEEVVERIDDAGNGTDRVSVADMIEALGKRSFGPLMLVPALIVFSPVGGIPGLPTVMAVIIALVAGQLLAGRKSVWLPRFLLSRSFGQTRLAQVSHFTMKGASYVDAVVGPRLTFLTDPPLDRLIAAFVIALCLVMPAMELIPFANSTTGAAISVFALAIVARDGLLALVAIAITGGVGWLGLSFLLS